MTYNITITRYGKPEVVYVHVVPRGGNLWYCTMSRLWPGNTRIHGKAYDCDKNCRVDVLRVLKLYAKFLENYYKV